MDSRPDPTRVDKTDVVSPRQPTPREAALETILITLLSEGSVTRPSPRVIELLKANGILDDVEWGLVPAEHLQAVYDYQTKPMQDGLHSRKARADLKWLVPYCGQLAQVVHTACQVVHGLQPPTDLEVAVKAFVNREPGEGEPHDN